MQGFHSRQDSLPGLPQEMAHEQTQCLPAMADGVRFWARSWVMPREMAWPGRSSIAATIVLALIWPRSIALAAHPSSTRPTHALIGLDRATGRLAQSRLQGQPQVPSSDSELQFPPTDDRGSTDRTIGGGGRLQFNLDLSRPRRSPPPSRGGVSPGPQRPDRCPRDPHQKPIILAPETMIGKTNAANPTVYIYLPQTQPNLDVEILVSDRDEGEILSSRTFKLSGQSGIARLSLLKPGLTLQPGQHYDWTVSLVCDPQDRMLDRSAIASIVREAWPKALSDRLSRLSPSNHLDRAEALAAAGFWYDTLDSAVRLHAQNPRDPNWFSLLESIELDEAVIRAGSVQLLP